MTTEEIQKRVAEIAAMSGDPESAHSAEDTLHQDVLQAIADGAAAPATLALEALKTWEIGFPRWCA